MKIALTVLLGTCLCLGHIATVLAAGAENAAGMSMPPKFLVVNREVLKPGKGGRPHESTESMFVRAMAAAKEPTHYLGMDAVSGRQPLALLHRIRFVRRLGKRGVSERRMPRFPPRSIARSSRRRPAAILRDQHLRPASPTSA